VRSPCLKAVITRRTQSTSVLHNRDVEPTKARSFLGVDKMRCIFKRQHATLAAVNGRLMVDVDVAPIRDFKNSIRPSFSNGRNHGSTSQDDRSFTFGIKESNVSKFSAFRNFKKVQLLNSILPVPQAE